MPILISFALTSFGAVRKGVHSLDEVLKCFIYTFRQTQTAQQYSKHVFIESEEKEGKKTQKCIEPYNLQIIIARALNMFQQQRRGNNANVHTSQST